MPRKRKPILNRTCPECGNIFQTTDQRKIYDRKKCREQASIKKRAAEQPIVNCAYCGKPFRLKPKRRKGAKHFCTDNGGKCRYAYHSESMKGDENPRWDGGRHIDSKGYRRIWVEGKGRIAEHRHVWEEAHGSIPDGYHVHHIDENPLNNHISNLRLVSHKEHQRIHLGLGGRWSRAYDACVDCGTTSRKHFGHGLCTACYTRHRRQELLTS